MWRTKSKKGEEKSQMKKILWCVVCGRPSECLQTSKAWEKIKEDKAIWENLSYFCAFLFTIEDDKQRPALGLFFPDSEGEPLSRSDVLNERVKGQELKMSDITEKGGEFWENERAALWASQKKKKMCFIFQNRNLENSPAGGPVCLMGVSNRTDANPPGQWPAALPKGWRSMSFWELPGHESLLFLLHKEV